MGMAQRILASPQLSLMFAILSSSRRIRGLAAATRLPEMCHFFPSPLKGSMLLPSWSVPKYTRLESRSKYTMSSFVSPSWLSLSAKSSAASGVWDWLGQTRGLQLSEIRRLFSIFLGKLHYNQSQNYWKIAYILLLLEGCLQYVIIVVEKLHFLSLLLECVLHSHCY